MTTARAIGDGNRGGFSDPELDGSSRPRWCVPMPAGTPPFGTRWRKRSRRLGVIPMYVEPTIAATRGGIVYHPRLDQQLVATEAEPAAGK